MGRADDCIKMLQDGGAGSCGDGMGRNEREGHTVFGLEVKEGPCGGHGSGIWVLVLVLVLPALTLKSASLVV